mgnify:CR=1 FL=1
MATSTTTNKRDDSHKIFDQMDADHSKSITRDEMTEFASSVFDEQMCQNLAARLKQSPDEAIQVATRVAMELATGKTGPDAWNAELTVDQFHAFRKNYVLNPDGTEEFFQRALFANFDKDESGELDSEELGHMLESIMSSSNAARRKRLSYMPGTQNDLEKLKKAIFKRYDVNGDKTLSFKEVRGILSGGASALVALKVLAEDDVDEEEEEEESSEGESDEEDGTDKDFTDFSELGDDRMQEELINKANDSDGNKVEATKDSDNKQEANEPNTEMTTAKAEHQSPKRITANGRTGAAVDPRMQASRLLALLETPEEAEAKKAEEDAIRELQSDSEDEDEEETQVDLDFSNMDVHDVDKQEVDDEEAEDNARKEEEERMLAETARASIQAKEMTRIVAEAQEAQQATKKEAEDAEKSRIETEEKEAEAEEAARKEAEEAEEQANKIAEQVEQARIQAEEMARIVAEAQEAQAAAKKEAEEAEQLRMAAEAKEAEEKARVEAEVKAKKEEEERIAARIEAEEQARREEEERARLKAEKKEAEENARNEARIRAEETARREEEERVAGEVAAQSQAPETAPELTPAAVNDPELSPEPEKEVPGATQATLDDSSVTSVSKHVSLGADANSQNAARKAIKQTEVIVMPEDEEEKQIVFNRGGGSCVLCDFIKSAVFGR